MTHFPAPFDPGWTWHDGVTGRPYALPRCAWCGRAIAARGFAHMHMNLYAPRGWQWVIGWHDRCFTRDPLHEGTFWLARQDEAAWCALLEAVRARSPKRIGPGDAWPRWSERDERILAHLRAHPDDALLVARELRVAGPWTCNGISWVRANPASDRGGTLADELAPATRESLERHDARLRAEGYLLAGPVPTLEQSPNVVPECGEVHAMTQGRPRLDRPEDTRRQLACQRPAGHVAACGALSPTEEDPHRECWWTASNAVGRP